MEQIVLTCFSHMEECHMDIGEIPMLKWKK